MIITEKFIRAINPCAAGLEWYRKTYPKGNVQGVSVVRKLIAVKNLDHANWLIARIMSRDQRIAYSIFAVELVLTNFEKKYPNDDRPRKAIEAAKEVLKNNNIETKTAADSAARSAADSRADSAYSAMRLEILKHGLKLLKGVK